MASDPDSTLPDPESKLSEKYFLGFGQPDRQDIAFVIASGRQCDHPMKIFHSIKDSLLCMTGNRTYGVCRNEERFVTDPGSQEIRRRIRTVHRIPGVNLMGCGKNKPDQKMTTPVLQQAHTYYGCGVPVNDRLEISDDRFLKIAGCDPVDTKAHSDPLLWPLEEKYRVVLFGKL